MSGTTDRSEATKSATWAGEQNRCLEKDISNKISRSQNGCDPLFSRDSSLNGPRTSVLGFWYENVCKALYLKRFYFEGNDVGSMVTLEDNITTVYSFQMKIVSEESKNVTIVSIPRSDG